MTKKTFPLTATILMLIAIAILCGLGTWQLKRLAWKQDIIAKLDAAYSSTINPQPLSAKGIANKDFTFGQITGQLIPAKAILMGPRTYDKKIGSHIIIPLVSQEGTTTLINLGWTDQKDLNTLSIDQTKPITITGLARIPYWNSFTPDNSPETDEWYKPDIQEIAATKNLLNSAPYIVYAETLSRTVGKNLPNHTRWYPKNNHANYATFWFAMAGVLLIIYWIRFFKRSS